MMIAELDLRELETESRCGDLPGAFERDQRLRRIAAAALPELLRTNAQLQTQVNGLEGQSYRDSDTIARLQSEGLNLEHHASLLRDELKDAREHIALLRGRVELLEKQTGMTKAVIDTPRAQALAALPDGRAD